MKDRKRKRKNGARGMSNERERAGTSNDGI